MNKIRFFAIPVASLAVSGPVSGHHSDAGMDMESVIAFEGTVREDGAHIDLEFVLEDPEYLAEPMVHRRQLIHSPHLEMLHGDCDPENTSRWVVE